MSPRPDAPPGETGRELTGADAFAVMHTLLQEATGTPKGRVHVKAIRRVGPRFLMTVQLTDTEQGIACDVTVRIERERLLELKNMASKALQA